MQDFLEADEGFGVVEGGVVELSEEEGETGGPGGFAFEGAGGRVTDVMGEEADGDGLQFGDCFIVVLIVGLLMLCITCLTLVLQKDVFVRSPKAWDVGVHTFVIASPCVSQA